MHIINVDTLRLEEFPRRPPDDYAILSHTWHSVASNEVLYNDIKAHGLTGCPDKPGKRKVEGCCRQAKAEGFKYVWIDSCCIDKSNAVELGEAINCMYRWYREAAVCYVYMEDVPNEDGVLEPGAAFSKSRWFTRGWTLQEMLAPPELHFFNTTWEPIAAKQDIIHELETITGVPRQSLLDFDPVTTDASVAQRMSWASHRVTTRDEDRSYCLLGLFDVNLPMIYGEGGRNAFVRLQQSVMEKTRDNSIFAWGLKNGTVSRTDRRSVSMGSTASGTNTDGPVSEGIWASHPSAFSRCGSIITRKPLGGTVFSFSSGCLQIDLEPFLLARPPKGDSNAETVDNSRSESHDILSTKDNSAVMATETLCYVQLNCGPKNDTDNIVVGIPLCVVTKNEGSNYTPVEYIRPKGYLPLFLVRPTSDGGARLPLKSISIRIEIDTGTRAASRQEWYGLRYPRKSLALVETYPQPAWRGSTARMPDADDVDLLGPHKRKWYLARLRPVAEQDESEMGKDMLFVAWVQPDGTKYRINGCLMAISQKTLIGGVAERAPYMRNSIYDHTAVSVNGMAMAASIEHEAKTFTIGPSTTLAVSDTMLDADMEMQHADKKLGLPDLFALQDDLWRAELKENAIGRSHSDRIAVVMERLVTVDDELKKLQDERLELMASISSLQQGVALSKAKADDLKEKYDAADRSVIERIEAANVIEAPTGSRTWLSELLLEKHADFTSCAVCRVHYHTDVTYTNVDVDVDSSPGSIQGTALERDAPDQVALFCAVAHGRIHVAEQLLRSGIDANAQLKRQRRPLLAMVAFDGNEIMANLLIRDGRALINRHDIKTAESPLWLALKHKHYDTAGVFVNRGANMDATYKDGDTLLQRAARSDEASIVSFLVQNGAKVETGESNITKAALVLAATHGHENVVGVLLGPKAASRYDNLDKIVQVALECAAVSGHAKVVQLLLAARPSNLKVMPLLSNAIRLGQYLVLKAVFEDKDTKSLAQQETGIENVLMEAVSKGFLLSTRVLLENGVPVDFVSAKDGLTPLTLAATNGFCYIAKVLLEHGAKVDLQPPHNTGTALYWAVKVGHEKTVRVLLAHGANPEAQVGSRDSPLKQAKGLKDKTILSVLKEHSCVQKT